MSKKLKKPSHLIMPLSDAAAEIMSFALLIESERPEHLNLTDEEIDARRGIGIALRRLSNKIRKYGRTLDEWSVRKGKSNEN